MNMVHRLYKTEQNKKIKSYCSQRAMAYEGSPHHVPVFEVKILGELMY